MDPELSWEDQFRNSIQAKAGNDTSTWNRPNRRRIAVPPHVYMPGKTGFQMGGMVFGIDISGSIDKVALNKMFSEAYGLLSEVKAEWTKVICVNGDVVEDQIFDVESPEDLMEVAEKINSGGGTDLETLAPWMADNACYPDQVVMFTDGLTSYSSTSPFDCEITWVLTTDRREPPYGTNVYMK